MLKRTVAVTPEIEEHRSYTHVEFKRRDGFMACINPTYIPSKKKKRSIIGSMA
jgi:hypothetical protein